MPHQKASVEKGLLGTRECYSSPSSVLTLCKVPGDSYLTLQSLLAQLRNLL